MEGALYDTNVFKMSLYNFKAIVCLLVILESATNSCNACENAGVGDVSVTSQSSEEENFTDGEQQFCEAGAGDACLGRGPAAGKAEGRKGGVAEETQKKVTLTLTEEAEKPDAENKDGWDKNGYVTFCPCMGNFGNQVELYLGGFAFAKAVNRTLIIPPFYRISSPGRRHERNLHHRACVPFTDFFRVDAVQEFHRAITMDDFLTRLAPKYWPQGQRNVYAYPFKGECFLVQSNAFYGTLSPPVEFDECILSKLKHDVNFSDEGSRRTVEKLWAESFPPQDHPVLAYNGQLGRFPINAGNRFLQKYLRWTDAAFAPARAYISETFGKDSWVAVHLRNGGDWIKACDTDIENQAFVMASPQCHEIKRGAVTKDMCLPSVPHMLELTSQVFQDVRAKHLFIATDNEPHLTEFRMLLEPLGVMIHHLNPGSPQVDLMVLGQADYFIGTCTSTFTSFVKRERDANGKPSIFWGQKYMGFH